MQHGVTSLPQCIGDITWISQCGCFKQRVVSCFFAQRVVSFFEFKIHTQLLQAWYWCVALEHRNAPSQPYGGYTVCGHSISHPRRTFRVRTVGGGCLKRADYQWIPYYKSVKQLGIECCTKRNWPQCSWMFWKIPERSEDSELLKNYQHFENNMVNIAPGMLENYII